MSLHSGDHQTCSLDSCASAQSAEASLGYFSSSIELCCYHLLAKGFPFCCCVRPHADHTRKPRTSRTAVASATKSVESHYKSLGRDVGTNLAPSRPRGRARGLGHWNASALKLPLDTLLTATLLSKVEAGGLDTHSIKLAAKQKNSPSDGMNGPVAPPICGRRAIVETAARELQQSTTESSLRLLRGRYPASRFPFADAVPCTRYVQV